MATILSKAKPIFEEERVFLSAKLRIDIPADCWTYGGDTRYIWHDLYQKDWFVKFKVDGFGNYTLVDYKTKSNRLTLYEPYETIASTLEKERERLEEYWQFAKERLKKYIRENPERHYSCNTSGGKDSVLVYELMHEAVSELDFQPDVKYHFSNTTNEVWQVYKYIKSLPDVEIHNPEIGWFNWLKKKNYYTPTILHRTCCSHYKEGSTTDIYGRDSEVTIITGVRNLESTKRAKYQFFMNHEYDVSLFGKSNYPKTYNKVCPIIELSNSDVWLMTMLKHFYISDVYKFGRQRVGCVFCPYSSNYEDDVNRRHYPKMSQRWENYLSEKYDHWSYQKKNCDPEFIVKEKDKYIHGGWKIGDSPETDEIKTMDENNVHNLSEKFGLSESMIWKYKKALNSACHICGGQIGFMDISMFYKLNGRYEGVEDNRLVPCKKCQMKIYGWKFSDWNRQLLKFQQEGCSLF